MIWHSSDLCERHITSSLNTKRRVVAYHARCAFSCSDEIIADAVIVFFDTPLPIGFYIRIFQPLVVVLALSFSLITRLSKVEVVSATYCSSLA